MRTITQIQIDDFHQHMILEEKSPATVEKYLRDIRAFAVFAGAREITKEVVMEYKQRLQERYAARSVNSMLAAINRFLGHLGWSDCRVRALKLQKSVYCAAEQELTREEYRRLLKAAEGDERLHLVMQAICSTGIRVSELRFFTVEAAMRGEVVVRCKGKTRTILLPGKLCRRLTAYAEHHGIAAGTIFLKRSGQPLDRKTVWAQMKALCRAAGVDGRKVFPHNLRKLFARAFYAVEKDIAKLADVLGHSSIDTTRIYIISTGTEHRRKIERLGLVA